MMSRMILDVILLISSGLIHCANSYCSDGDQVSITRCAQPLYDIGAFKSDSSSQTFSWDLFTRTSSSYFREVCDAFVRFDLCTHPYTEQCLHEEPMKSQYETALSILDYLCHEGYRDMLQNYNCIVDILRDQSMLECQTVMQTNVQQESTDAEKDEQICRAMQYYLRCMRSPIVKRCGLRAWAVIREVVQRPTALMIPNCSVSRSTTLKPSSVFLGLSVALTFAAFSQLAGAMK